MYVCMYTYICMYVWCIDNYIAVYRCKMHCSLKGFHAVSGASELPEPCVWTETMLLVATVINHYISRTVSNTHCNWPITDSAHWFLASRIWTCETTSCILPVQSHSYLNQLGNGAARSKLILVCLINLSKEMRFICFTRLPYFSPLRTLLFLSFFYLITCQIITTKCYNVDSFLNYSCFCIR